MPKPQNRVPLLGLQCLFLVAAMATIFLPWTISIIPGLTADSPWVTGNSAWSMSAIGRLLTALLPASFCISILERRAKASAKVLHFTFFGITLLVAYQPWKWVLNDSNASLAWGFGCFLFCNALFYASTLMISSVLQNQEA